VYISGTAVAQAARKVKRTIEGTLHPALFLTNELVRPKTTPARHKQKNFPDESKEFADSGDSHEQIE
jgi:hypothetical protein